MGGESTTKPAYVVRQARSYRDGSSVGERNWLFNVFCNCREEGVSGQANGTGCAFTRLDAGTTDIVFAGEGYDSLATGGGMHAWNESKRLD